MAEPVPPIVEARQLQKSYKGFRALGPIDVTVRAGAVGLLGPNGAGKTTFIKTLLGLIPVTAGSAKVLGLDVTRRQLDIRQRVGYMPERDAQIINMTGFQYVAFCGEMAGLPRRDAIQRSHEILNYVGLGEERYRPVETYSTGMRQRAKLAQAIVHDPRLVFLDEPTNGLDPRGRTEMLDLIRDLTYKRGISVIVSSHLLPDVEYVCKDVVVLKAGKVVSQGNIEDLKKRNLARYEARIKGDPGAFDRALRARKIPAKIQEGGLFLVELEKSQDTGVLLRAATEAKVQLRHLQPTRSTLEDVFLEKVDATPEAR
jgi:ABC-2 type transport system ATP-binding protein